jgi:hypothetical protein
MISMQISQDCRVAEFGSGSPTCCERCQRQVAEAQKEMSAFVITVGRKWGAMAAASAAEYWIELAKSVSPSLVDGRPDWRNLTIMASSRLVNDSWLNAHTVRD